MELQDKIHGFSVTACRLLPELGGKLWELEHEASGAKLVWLDRADDNRTFAIAFRALPEDDTGVLHILEHAVFCGSDRYPVRRASGRRAGVTRSVKTETSAIRAWCFTRWRELWPRRRPSWTEPCSASCSRTPAIALTPAAIQSTFRS